MSTAVASRHRQDRITNQAGAFPFFPRTRLERSRELSATAYLADVRKAHNARLQCHARCAAAAGRICLMVTSQ